MRESALASQQCNDLGALSHILGHSMHDLLSATDPRAAS